MFMLPKVHPDLSLSCKNDPDKSTKVDENLHWSYYACTNNIHQMAQGNKFQLRLSINQSVVLTRRQGIGRNNRKTLGIGCSEFVGIGS